VNDACVLTGKRMFYGSIFRFEGQASVFATEDGPCYRCLYPEPPPPGLVPSCAEGGVLWHSAGAGGSEQATEVIKLILGVGEPLIGRLLADRCAGHEVPRAEAEEESGLPGLRNASYGDEADRLQRVLRNSRGGKTGGKWSSGNSSGRVEASSGREGRLLFVLDVREPHEYQICNIGGHLIPLNDLPKPRE